MKNDSELFERAIGGDRTALQSLLLAHHDSLKAEVLRRARLWGIEDEADELVQEVYAEATRSIGRFRDRGEGSFGAWLRRIAHHCAVDMIRAQGAAKRGKRQRAGRAEIFESLLQQVESGATTVRTVLARREALAAVRDALHKLSEDQHEAIVQRFLMGREFKAISAEMRRPPAAVQMLCQRGLERLKRSLADHLG